MIKEFQNEFRWLSNFIPVQIKSKEFIFRSVEHAYMAAKSNSRKWKKVCLDTKNPGKVKRLSKDIELIDNWETKKVAIMEDLLRQKFSIEPFKTLLLNTKDQYIQEGNMWGDKFWGVCLKTNKGKNVLGKLIMQIRKELKAGK